MAQTPPVKAGGSCFLLQELGKPDIRRGPTDVCTMRVAPQSTFKIPHALAALDAGVIAGADTTFRYDGSAYAFASWRRDHSLQSAMRNSALWYFQRLAEQLGLGRERVYLQRFDYGNADPSSGLTTFWLGGSLQISPEEQLRFVHRLFDGSLPVSAKAVKVVRDVLIQPRGRIVNAAGEHAFGQWPAGTVVRAKTGSGSAGRGRAVRWLVGHVSRGGREWIFVSCVIGGETTPPLAAVDLAAAELRREHVL
jgi:beta-lactamase class D